MDPRLAELAREGDADDEVMAVLRLRRAGTFPGAVRVVAQFGRIVTVRLRRSDIVRVRTDPAVRSMKAPVSVIAERATTVEDVREPEEVLALDELPSDVRRPAGLAATGRGTLVAVLDWGLDFTHPNFRRADGGTRAVALWDQRGEGDPRAPAPYGYGVLHGGAALDAALATAEPFASLGYELGGGDEGGTHGTHVMDIAAGAGRVGPSGIAPDAELLFVHLAASRGGFPSLGDSVSVLEAIDFAGRTAGRRPLVINMSMGNIAGPHDGTTLVEQAIDAFVAAAPGRAIVQSCGNYFTRNTHVAGLVRPGARVSLTWLTDAADVTPNTLEVWYDGADRFRVRLDAPEALGTTGWVALGDTAELRRGDEVMARLYHRARDPNNGDHQIVAFAYPTAPAGRWQLVLEGEDVVDGRFHSWIERDEGCATCQSHFDVEQAVVAGTTGTIANGRRTIAVGAYDAHAASFRVGPFSSMGPTRDGRSKPDLVAPGVAVLAARSTPPGAAPGQGLLTRKSGTSMAAPHVTGTVALMFEAARRGLPITETRRHLLATTARDGVPSGLTPRVGGGRLDIAAAVTQAAGSQREGKMSTETLVPVAHAEETAGCGCGGESSDALAEREVPAGVSEETVTEAVVGQLSTTAGMQPIEVDDAAAFESASHDEGVQFALQHGTSWVLVGDSMRGPRTAVRRMRRAVRSGGADVLDADIPGADTIVLGGDVYMPASLVARGTRWVRVPRAREFYALAASDQREQRSAWIGALLAARPAITISGVTIDRAWLEARSMVTLRALLAEFASRAVRVSDVNQRDRSFVGAQVHGLTLPVVSYPVREPDCYLPVIAAREGKLEAINAYDLGAGISLGPIQFNLQRSAVIWFLDRLQVRDPALLRDTLGAPPLSLGVQPHDDHMDLVVRGATTIVSLHGRSGDQRRNIAWFQSGDADPARDGLAHIDAAHRRALAAKFRDAVVWPHVQELIIETCAWWLDPMMQKIDAAGIPRLDPANPDQTLFTLRALLLSAAVRFSACLAPLLRALAAWTTVAEKLEHLNAALESTSVNWGTCTPARRTQLRTRLTAQRPHADRVFGVISRLRTQTAAHTETLADVGAGADALVDTEAGGTPLELASDEMPCGGEWIDDDEAEEPVISADPVSASLDALDWALASRGLTTDAPGLAQWLYEQSMRDDAADRTFEVVGAPANRLRVAPARGDVLVERSIGHRGGERVSVVTRDGVVPGRPAAVETALLHGPASPSTRHVLRADGRLRPGALLLRPLAPPIEQDVDPFDCGGGVRVAQAIADAIQRARALAGVAFRVASPPCAATRRCPANLAADHARGGATHLVNLDRDQARIADITALWGVDVHSVRSESARAAKAVKVLRPGAPADALSFVAIRGGTTREIHLATVAQGAARRVESRVDGAVWRNLAQTAQSRGIPYVLTKSRYPEASLHRQWGHEDTIDWLLALATFYLSQTGQFLGVGDVSHVLGEEMTDHGSHRVGRDVDLYVVDFPNQSTGIPRMFWCEGDDATALTLRPRTPPASASQSFGPMGAPLAGTELDTVRRRYATILAYCLLTWDRLNTVAWHGAQWLRADAQAIARTAAGSWNTAWGPAPSATTPAGPAKASELARKLVGQGHADYGAGRGWPPHQDHLHVRLTT